MTNKNIEDIDQLFREGLNPAEDHFTAPGSAWGNMEQRLNRYERRKGAILWLTRLGGVAALILLFYVVGNLFTEQRLKNKEKVIVEQKDIKQAPAKPSKQQQAQKLPDNQPQLDDSLGQGITTLKRPSTGENLALHKKQEKANQRTDLFATNREGKTKDMDTLQKETINLENTAVSPEIIEQEENPEVTEPQPNTPKEISRPKEPVYTTIDEEVQKPLTERPVHKMALSLMAAPAYNGVGNLNNGSMGEDIGLLVSLEVARNWKFSTGGIYAKKLYDAGFKDYKPENNIWSEYYPQTVNADCRVLDIPLNLSYTFLKGKDRTVSIGTGLSSYIMLSEDYRFTYAETDIDTPLNYRIVNQNQHWLSVVNLQASIEQRLSKRVSISLQPYMKMPLTDIGFAGVKLQSLGMAANLNWNFSL